LHGASASADPRRHAVLTLARVEVRRAHAARLLGDATPFLRELVLGVLRWQLVLDHLLAPHLRQPAATLDPEIRAALRAGLYEALRMDTPAPVAVAEAVRVARSLVPAAAGLVNAVLRRAVAAGWCTDEDAPLWLRHSHPAWLVERWATWLPADQLEAALQANQRPAPLYLLAAVSPVEELAGEGCEVTPHPYVPGVLCVAHNAGAVAAWLRRGRGYAIDPHAVAVARLLPDVDGPTVDWAAAPGGKSLVLASERPARFRVALDRHLGRVLTMGETVKALTGAAPPAVVAGDGTLPPFKPGSLAAVVLDAPCSGTGTLRRHPEIRWRLVASDLAGFQALQRRLLAAAAAALRPGGWVLYVTCSLEPEENGQVIDGAPLLEVVPLPPEGLAHLPAHRLPSGGVTIPPGQWGDGFTVHLLRRPAAGPGAPSVRPG
jgi:16S rRNA (cytosine967-C5)-methyltransferase